MFHNDSCFIYIPACPFSLSIHRNSYHIELPILRYVPENLQAFSFDAKVQINLFWFARFILVDGIHIIAS